MLFRSEVDQTLVFTATKRAAEDLSGELLGKGFDAGALHGDMRQRERNATLAQLRDGSMRVLVATDVAARGIDIPGLTHVINFDAPRQAEDYLHRIGRTGRAGRSGTAVTLLAHAERHLVRTIERYTGSALTVGTIAGLEPRARPASLAPRRGASRPSYGAPRSAGGGRPSGEGRPSFSRTRPSGDSYGFDNDRKRTRH